MIGRTLAHYEVLEKIGEGGMGQVYRARDATLDREVALKFLPAAVVQDPSHLARFEREARLLASLNHPGIASVFGLHEVDGQRFLAMELVPGEDLSRILARGPLPAAEAVALARQVGDALAAAHDQGVVHRDLKPSNIMVTPEGRAKVLDFGLAKSTTDTGVSDLSNSPTLTSPATVAGVILGTAAYMSPEQSRGKPVDRRSDIWSFGCVVYEMLTGHRAFAGETVSDIIAAIIHRDPEWDRMPADTPPGLRYVVAGCLRKDPAARFRDAGDVSLLLGEGLTGPGNGEPAAPAARSRGLLWPAVAAVLALGLLASWFLVPRGGSGDEGPVVIGLEPLTDLPGVQGTPSISRDGRLVVYSGPGEHGDADIFLLRVGGDNPVNLTPDEREPDLQPALSPDGESIAFSSFRAGGGLFVMGATGESPTRVAEVGFDAAWSPDGTRLAFTDKYVTDPLGRGGAARLAVLELSTGESRVITPPEVDAVDPAWSPSGRRIAFTNAYSIRQGQRDVWTVGVDGGDARPVFADEPADWAPRWSPDGRWLYFVSDRGGPPNLWRVAIDEETGEPSGSPRRMTTVSEEIRWFDLSGDGSRAVLDLRHAEFPLDITDLDPETPRPTSPLHRLPVGTLSIQASFSPSGDRIAYRSELFGEWIHLLDLASGTRRLLVGDSHRNRGPSWKPTGDWITLYTNRSGSYDIWAIRPDGTDLRAVTAQEGDFNNPVWSRNGRLFSIHTPPGGTILIVEIDVSGWATEGPDGNAPFTPVKGSEGVTLRGVNPAGTHLVGIVHDREAQPRSVVVEIATGERTYLVHPDGEAVAGDSLTRAWLDDHRFLIWDNARRTAVVADIRDGSARNAPEIPGPADFTYSRATGKLLVNHTSEEGDLWILHLGDPDGDHPAP